ncbi:MAG TPA: nucleoside hydrolase [archaeon]|nr:nucleoside hydrolase [archaeon]
MAFPCKKIRSAYLFRFFIPLLIFWCFDSPASAGPQGSADKIKVIIDTDIAEDIDDILVTAFALNSPEFEVLAITTVDGGVWARTRVARKAARLFGKPQVQVAAGYVRNIPLDDIEYKGFEGGVRYGEVAPDEEGLPPASLLKADELIARLAMKYPGEVTVLTIGSMANIGQFLVRFPEAAKKLKRIVTNGGYLSPDGKEQSIGWNLRYDPIAAMITARSEVPWVLLSEGASRYASPRKEDIERIRNKKIPSTELLVQAIHWWRTNKTDATSLPHVSDLNVFAYLLGLLPTERGNVFIEIGPQGTLPGFRIDPDPEGRIEFGRVIPKEKAESLRELLIERLVTPPELDERMSLDR